ncbi:H(+)-transporting V1 sector ATPase subunit D [Recurvomyces mirabilis]|nr:H(+)-transporting V1 sector ATPase subunit D [Recurvomyces mirabilis]
MSGANDREAVFPTRQSLGAMKSKLKGAQVGHDLLKRKSEALTKRFREITRRIDEAKRKMGRVMQIAAFSLAEVTYAVGNSSIAYQITESVKQAKFRVRTRQENVSGVFLPQFESVQRDDVGSDFQMTGLGKGGQQVQKCRETYTRAVETLVELASLQTAFVILDEVIKVVNRRVNAMYALHPSACEILTDSELSEHVIIPRTENTIKYINSELDELDREEFFRLKKVKGVKERAQAEQEAERNKTAQNESDKENQQKRSNAEDAPTTNVLGDEGDEDVIF